MTGTTSSPTRPALRHGLLRIGCRLVLGGACLSALGCLDDVPPATSTVVDSAGIRVVTSSTPAWDEESGWSISGEPVLQIGADEGGDPDLQFAYITGVHRLPGDEIAVVDAWTSAIHFFDSLGTHLGRAGGTGSGPGEFPPGSVPTSFTCGRDTVYVRIRQQVSAFVPPGRHVRSFSLDPPTRLYGCHQDRMVGEQAWSEGRTEPGTFTDSVALVWYDLGGDRRSVIDTLPMQDRTWRGAGTVGLGYMPTLFGDGLAVAAQPGNFATGFSGTGGIEIRDEEGAVRRVVRAPAFTDPVTEADTDRFRDFVFSPWRGNENEQRALEEELNAVIGESRPAFAELKWDSRGNLWARRHDHLDAIAYFDWSVQIRSGEIPMLDEPRRWLVFDSAGAWLGQVDTPARFTVHEIGDRDLIGVWRDDFDIPYVRAYRIVKDPGSEGRP